MARLSRGWYGDRLDEDFTSRSIAQLQDVLTDVGLRGAFWKLN